MSKILQINITSEGTTGRVDIIGSISEWNRNNATDFRTKCQELKDNGVTSCHVYLNTTGGDCLQANEIVNILTEIFGSYTGEGGAIVASAGTYIAVKATSFVLAENGQFMIHKPSGGVWGNENDIENYLKAVKNMTVTYYNAYIVKLSKPESDFKAKWDSGDFWMTAQEAKEWGFVSEVKKAVKIDADMAQAIRACGSPIEIQITNPNNDTTMNLEATATALGLPKDATQEQINAKITDDAKKLKEFEATQAKQRTDNIKALLDKSEQEHRIKATDRAKWEAKLNEDFDGTKALLDGIEPVKKISGSLKSDTGGNGTYQGKTFEQLQDENPDLLAELQDENPEVYDGLFAAWKKRNGIK